MVTRYVVGGCISLLFAWTSGRVVGAAEQLDRYGGCIAILGHADQSFHLERLGQRWWLITPDGHGMFVRAVSKVDTADYGGSGGFAAYDGVYVESAAGEMSSNLQAAAQNSIPRDVVHPGTGATLRARGDALYLGSSRFKPNYTYVWLDQLGHGGKVRWYYSTGNGWEPVGGTGNPCGGAVLNEDGSYNLDIGNYMAPDDSGFGAWENRGANRLVWWDMTQGFPADFAPVALPNDPVRRYYLKGVVQQDFTVAPVLNQTYERADLGEGIARKYSPGDYYQKWAAAITQRLKEWGFNAAGQYSYRYVANAAKLADRLPVEPTWALGGWATRKDYPYHVKNVYAGAVFPPGSKTLLYQGLQPDVFEPGFERAYMEMVRKQAPTKDSWSWALIPEEADYLFGINSQTHDHMGYVVLSQNPYHPRATREGQEIVYQDPRLYAKYALRDFLRDRYRAAGDPLPDFQATDAVPRYTYSRDPQGAELAALENLNRAWGTHYTTWDTSTGDLVKGDNAWATGTGFMDENGKGVLAPNTRSVGFDKQFTDPAHPAIRQDLDDFVALFAGRYGVVLEKAFGQVAHPILLLPIYNGPAFVYKALGPYVDGFWVNVADPQDALTIYDSSHRPLVVADYLTADPDSPLYFNVRIESVRFDPASGSTIITAPDLRYVFRLAQTVAFPDCPGLLENYQRLGRPYPYPRIKSAHWNTVELAGDYTQFVKPGSHMELYKYGRYPYARQTQGDRARDMIQRYESLLKLRGDDGMYFVIGIEHWCLYDPAVSNWCDNQNFGLATFQDNAYDGVEARRAIGVDARGYPIGGEDADYGDLLTDLSSFLRSVHDRIRAE